MQVFLVFPFTHSLFLTMQAHTETPHFHFFKILLDKHTHTMNLPTTFTKLYGQTLTNPIMLRTPTGIEWQLYFTRNQSGVVSFTNGWEDFYNHYKLDHGSCIFFQYHGSSNFAVFIHDLTVCQIPYTTFDNVKREPTDGDGLPLDQTLLHRKTALTSQKALKPENL